MHRRILSLVLALPSLASAQQTWVVDFTGATPNSLQSIAAAVNVASAGDTIRILGGSFPGFSIDKGLTILAEPPAFIGGLLSVRDVPAGQQVVVQGLNVFSIPPSLASHQGIEIVDNAGSVHFDDVDMPLSLPFQQQAVLQVENNALVTLVNCDYIAWGFSPTVRIVGSTATLARCNITAGNSPGSAAVECIDSEVAFGACFVRATGYLTDPAAESLHVASGAVTIGAGSTFAAIESTAPAAAIRIDGGSVVVDGSAVVDGFGGALDYVGLISPTLGVVPSVAPLSTHQTLALEVIGTPQAVVGVWLGGLTTPISMPFGTLWTSAPLLLLGSGAIPLDGEFFWLTPLPSAIPDGFVANIQAATITTFGSFELSTPMTVVLRP